MVYFSFQIKKSWAKSQIDEGMNHFFAVSSGQYTGQTRGIYFKFALRVKISLGFFGSLLSTTTALTIGPFLFAVSTFAVISPFSPGLIWLELARATVHPQEPVTFFITRTSVPLFLISNTCSS